MTAFSVFSRVADSDGASRRRPTLFATPSSSRQDGNALIVRRFPTTARPFCRRSSTSPCLHPVRACFEHRCMRAMFFSFRVQCSRACPHCLKMAKPCCAAQRARPLACSSSQPITAHRTGVCPLRGYDASKGKGKRRVRTHCSKASTLCNAATALAATARIKTNSARRAQQHRNKTQRHTASNTQRYTTDTVLTPSGTQDECYRSPNVRSLLFHPCSPYRYRFRTDCLHPILH